MKIKAKILRDAALRPTSIKVKGLKVDYEYYPSGAVSEVILSGPRASLPNLFRILDMIYPKDVTVSIRGSAWYDRNAADKSLEYNAAGVAPHTVVARQLYTCPAGKMAFVGAMYIYVRRATVAAPLGVVLAGLSFAGNVRFVVRHVDNNVGVEKSIELYLGAVLQQGQPLELTTVDSSTGGTMDYLMSVVVTEFDA